MKTITLTQGYSAIVDDEDYEYLSQFKWRITKENDGKPYAARRKGSGMERMHNAVMPHEKPFVVDHINLDRLDNRRSNLRLCTGIENNRNNAIRKDNTSGFKGVSLHSASGLWRAQIRVDGKRLCLCYSKSKEEAYSAYCDAAKKYFGEFARLQ